MTTENRDMNRDPITGTPGSHPVGVGVGGVGGAAAGAAVGSIFGPIGTLIGGAVGAIAGAGTGKAVAERLDPTGEQEYWQAEYANRPYYQSRYAFEDYAPAYEYGDRLRAEGGNRTWDERMDAEAREGWDAIRAKSALAWEDAREAVRDAFDRTDRTYRAYDATDSYYGERLKDADYYREEFDYRSDYSPAYRYGTYARAQNADRPWDSALEADLERGWERAKGKSRLAWSDAKNAVRDAWHGVERALPGDADGDGR